MSLENCYPIIRLGDELTFIFTSENSDGLNPITKILHRQAITYFDNRLSVSRDTPRYAASSALGTRCDNEGY